MHSTRSTSCSAVGSLPSLIVVAPRLKAAFLQHSKKLAKIRSFGNEAINDGVDASFMMDPAGNNPDALKIIRQQ